jgi:hypothetical protein
MISTAKRGTPCLGSPIVISIGDAPGFSFPKSSRSLGKGDWIADKIVTDKDAPNAVFLKERTLHFDADNENAKKPGMRSRATPKGEPLQGRRKSGSPGAWGGLTPPLVFYML